MGDGQELEPLRHLRMVLYGFLSFHMANEKQVVFLPFSIKQQFH